MRKGRRIACDFGDVRIGLAISDTDGRLATPLLTLANSPGTLMAQMQEIIAEYNPIEIYVGRPMHLKGISSQSALKAENFAKEIRQVFAGPVSMIDERLSTVTAHRQLKEAGKSTRQSREVVDQIAAMAILELALDIEKSKNSRDA